MLLVSRSELLMLRLQSGLLPRWILNPRFPLKVLLQTWQRFPFEEEVGTLLVGERSLVEAVIVPILVLLVVVLVEVVVVVVEETLVLVSTILLLEERMVKDIVVLVEEEVEEDEGKAVLVVVTARDAMCAHILGDGIDEECGLRCTSCRVRKLLVAISWNLWKSTDSPT